MWTYLRLALLFVLGATGCRDGLADEPPTPFVYVLGPSPALAPAHATDLAGPRRHRVSGSKIVIVDGPGPSQAPERRAGDGVQAVDGGTFDGGTRRDGGYPDGGTQRPLR